jgi:hypothetical protein
MGTWWTLYDPSICFPAMDSGPVYPFGVLMMIIGQIWTIKRSFYLKSNIFDQRNSVSAVIQSTGHGLVNQPRIATFDNDWLVPITDEESPELRFRNAIQDGWVGDLEPILVQDGQYNSICLWIKKLVAVPRSCKGSCFSLSVANDTCNNQIWFIHDRTKSAGQGVARLTTLMH